MKGTFCDNDNVNSIEWIYTGGGYKAVARKVIIV